MVNYNIYIPRLAILKTHLYSRANELNKDLLKDYTIKKKNEKITTYKCNKNGATIEIEDDNISLTLRDINSNMSDSDKAKSLIDVARAKDWDISKVEVFGSGFFKVEFEKQLKAELQKNQEKTKNKEENSFQIER